MPRPTMAETLDKKGWRTIGDLVKTYPLSRKTKFDFKFIEIAARLKMAGLSDENIAFVLGVNKSTVNAWKKDHPQFKQACQEGKKVATSYVIAQALRAACGYDYEDANEKWVPHPEKKEANGQPLYILKEKSVFKKHQAPNPQLLMFLLCNLDRNNWSSVHKVQVDENKNVNIRIDGKVVAAQIEDLAGKFIEHKTKKVVSKEITDEVKHD